VLTLTMLAPLVFVSHIKFVPPGPGPGVMVLACTVGTGTSVTKEPSGLKIAIWLPLYSATHIVLFSVGLSAVDSRATPAGPALPVGIPNSVTDGTQRSSNFSTAGWNRAVLVG